MFVAGCGYVDDDVAVEVWGLGALGRHCDGEGAMAQLSRIAGGPAVQLATQVSGRLSGSRRAARGASTRKEVGLGRRKVQDVSEVGSWQLQLPGLECQ
jgi:hypothetical protein